ncbi:hypothetical protein [Labrenzia sp. 011]|uniref:hypothetical protein n=1 Tax=Labrenzia sp. 011 TaxID=2171494 RepID=UPI000D518AF2|nr:hypothetical protein [Labrenzia sp. 011]PVB62731.1 hypothetical protein DCO57_05645 [Labrenzia sp. 011]
MYEPQPKLTVREIIRDTFTPSRVGLLSWAFAAVLMGTVGLASFQFGSQKFLSSAESMSFGGMPLPSGGDISTTASIGSSGPTKSIGIMQMPGTARHGNTSDLTSSQIEVLQRELVSLRRRLSALAEQNLAYSRRIAALEQEVAVGKLSASAHTASDEGRNAVEPGPGVIVTMPAPETISRLSGSGAAKSAPSANVPVLRPDAAGDTEGPPPSAPAVDVSRPSPETPPRRITLYRNEEPRPAIAELDIDTQEPVRIVTLPDARDSSRSTGSIPPQDAKPSPESFEATPTTPDSQPTVIVPSGPAGKVSSSGDSLVNRSDFGAVIGRYESEAAAAAAWARFKEQNRERMHDLTPLLSRPPDSKGRVSLLVGPFANAADAAVACLHLLEVTALCHPVLFAGETLVTTAQFRSSAF